MPRRPSGRGPFPPRSSADRPGRDRLQHAEQRDRPDIQRDGDEPRTSREEQLGDVLLVMIP